MMPSKVICTEGFITYQGEGGKRRKKERGREGRFFAFQKCSQRHLAVISAKVHQTSDRVRLKKK